MSWADGKEQAADLVAWTRNGAAQPLRAVYGKRARVEVSIGRAASRRRLGFEVNVVTGRAARSRERLVAEFCLDRDQVAALRDYLTASLPRLLGTGARYPVAFVRYSREERADDAAARAVLRARAKRRA